MIVIDSKNVVQYSSWKIELVSTSEGERFKSFISENSPEDFVWAGVIPDFTLIDGVVVPDYTKSYKYENNTFIVINPTEI